MAYRLSKRIGKHTWVCVAMRRAANVITSAALRTRTYLRDRVYVYVQKRGLPHAAHAGVTLCKPATAADTYTRCHKRASSCTRSSTSQIDSEVGD